MHSHADWIAVDWGTSNLRAWGIDAAGEIVFSRASDQGMGKLQRGQFPAALTALLDGALPEGNAPIDVLICGMAGARQGWMEAPYVDAPADLSRLAYGAITPEMPDSRLKPRILPGVCQKRSGAEDVMRGEETQILGLTALAPGFSGTVIMPGTHSKWVEVERHRLQRFSTAMSGELFEVLRAHSVLRHSLQGAADGPDREGGFLAGAQTGLDAPEKLTSLLFKVRAASLLSARGPDWCAGYLSGLLIGAEIGGHRDWHAEGEIILIGSPTLMALYARLLDMAGKKSRMIDAAEATIAGLKAARQRA